MISETATPHLDVMLCTLYVVLEAGYFIHQKGITGKISQSFEKEGGQDTLVKEWKRELVSHDVKGATAVNDWVDGWFDVMGPVQSRFKDVRRGNVEAYLAERVFGLSLKDVLSQPTKHHILIGLVSELERKRNRRFPSGSNGDLRLSPAQQSGQTPYRLLFFCFMAFLYPLIGQMFDRSQTASIARSFRTSPISKSSNPPSTTASAVTPTSEPHLNAATRAIPASSSAMVSSLSNLSCIGMCTAPPLRTRQRSRTIDTVIACAQIPVSSLAMMSSESNLSSIGMCAAPPLRTRQRSRSSVVGYASAVPFAFTQKISAAA